MNLKKGKKENMNREQWLAERRLGVGASDIADVLTLEPYGCARRLFYEKVGVPSDYAAEDKAIFDRGRRMEPVILEMVQEYHPEVDVKTATHESRRGTTPHHRASPDGYAYERTTSAGMVIESKTAGERAWRRMVREGLPEAYGVQLQWSMHVFGVRRGIFAVLWPDGWQFRSWIVERDQSLIDELVFAVDEFWYKVTMAKANSAPAEYAPERLMPTDRRCQRCSYRTTCQGRALLDSAGKDELVRNDLVILGGSEARKIEDIAERYMSLRELASEAEDMLEAVKDELKAALGERGAVEVRGARIYNRPVSSLRVDTRKLKQKYADVYKDVVKESISQPLKVYSV